MEQRLALGGRARNGAGAVGGEQRFQVRAGDGGDELAALLGEQGGDGGGVGALGGGAGDDEGAGVDAVGRQVGLAEGGGHDRVERGGVDLVAGGVGGEGDRRAGESLAVDDLVARGEADLLAAQREPREDEVSSGRADVDADAGDLG